MPHNRPQFWTVSIGTKRPKHTKTRLKLRSFVGFDGWVFFWLELYTICTCCVGYRTFLFFSDFFVSSRFAFVQKEMNPCVEMLWKFFHAYPKRLVSITRIHLPRRIRKKERERNVLVIDTVRLQKFPKFSPKLNPQILYINYKFRNILLPRFENFFCTFAAIFAATFFRKCALSDRQREILHSRCNSGGGNPNVFGFGFSALKSHKKHLKWSWLNGLN